MWKNDIKIVITILLATVVTDSLAPYWCNWLMNSALGICLQEIHDFLKNYSSVNIILAGFLFFFGVFWAWRTLRDRDFRWYRPALLLWGYVILFDKNTLDTVTIIGTCDYKDLAKTIGLIILLVMACKVFDWCFPFMDSFRSWWTSIQGKMHAKHTLDTETGFPNDEIESNKIPKLLQRYAEVITEKLMATNLNEHSFAVGITGEWGSGKTTFLDLLESKLVGEAEVVKFNPWMCRTPEQVTEDFFASLQQQLSPRHSSLSKPIKDYAKYITNATLSWGHGLFSKFAIAFPQDSLQEKKKRLSERFSILKKPVVVIIDDLDRLESSEVFEVLRLIRNTADLRNTIYVVAYDKEYVTSVLGSKNIMEPVAYLEKIFPVEIHQPKVEDYQIVQLLYRDLKRIKLLKGNFADELLKRISQRDKQLIVKILGNYRQTRRFVRVYSLNVQYIQKVSTNEIKLMDLFWMELLQQYDKSVYDTLSREPSKFLYLQGDRYYLRPGIKETTCFEAEKRYEYKDGIIWKEETPQILDKLFGKYGLTVVGTSICKTENYEKFFTLGVSPYKLSKREFRDLFAQKGDEDNRVKGWIDDGKYLNSIVYQFENFNVKEIDDSELRQYIKGLLSFGFILCEYDYEGGRIVRRLLEKQRYKAQHFELGKQVVLSCLNEKRKQSQSYKALTKLLNKFYLATEYDENNKKQAKKPLLIDNSDVERLLTQSLSDYLKQHTDLTVLSFFDENSEAGVVFGNCCVQTVESLFFDENNEWKNIGIEVVVNHFKGQNKLPLAKEKEAIDKMFVDDIPDVDDDPDAQEYYANAVEHREYQLSAYFGSSNEQFKKMIEACFAKDANGDGGDSAAQKKSKKNDNGMTFNKTKKNKNNQKR